MREAAIMQCAQVGGCAAEWYVFVLPAVTSCPSARSFEYAMEVLPMSQEMEKGWVREVGG